jgi:N-acyl-D-amino-acid deacylase
VLDLKIRGARIIDGTGNPWFRADVGIEGGTITRLGDLSGAQARESIDAADACLAPGFIDIHTHSDFTLPRFPRAESMVAQGVTTEVTGNCGLTPYPVAPDKLDLLQRYTAFMGSKLSWEWRSTAEFLDYLDRLPLAHNVVPQVGHGAVRIAAMGFENRQPTAAELAAMEQLVADALEAGVFGLSSGLIYTPGTYADTAELIALCRVVKRYGGFYSTHMRNEADHLVAAVDEALTIGREAGVPVQLSHHKAMGERNWGRIEETLGMADKARAEGHDVTLDQYPYSGSSTTFTAFLPTWSLAGGVEQLLVRLADPALRKQIRDEADAAKPMGWDKVLVAGVRSEENKPFEGMTIAQVGSALGMDGIDAGIEMTLREKGPFSIIRFGMSEEDVRRVMRHPHVMVASDGYAFNPAEGGKPHPRSYGTFARVLGRYVREEGNLALEEAVRKMSSLPAQRLGLWDRGIIRPGCAADLVLFRPEAVREEATFQDPHRYASGVECVWVNGIQVWGNGSDTGAAAGRVFRRGGAH